MIIGITFSPSRTQLNSPFDVQPMALDTRGEFCLECFDEVSSLILGKRRRLWREPIGTLAINPKGRAE